MMKDSSPESQLSQALTVLEVVVLRRDHPDEPFVIVGDPPEWLDWIFGGVSGLLHCPFLEDFLEHLKETENPDEIERSGLWQQDTPDGKTAAFQAIIRNGNGNALLIVNAMGEYFEEIGYLTQRANESALGKRRVEKLFQRNQILLECIIHDLNNPLSSIMMNLQYLGRQVHSKLARDLIVIAERQAKRQEELIRSIMDVFAPEMASLTAVSRSGPSAPLVAAAAEAAVEAQDVVASANRVNLTLHNLVPDETRVVGEHLQLVRVLENLVVNAIRHSPDGAEVLLRIRFKGNDILFEVADDGPGVEVRDRERIFRPFVRGNNNGQRGLGLYFCKITVERWGGVIGVRDRSDPKKGACFWVRLPIARES